MGRVRLTSLNFSIDMLRHEVDTFRVFTQTPGWIAKENYSSRRRVVDGLTFVMLNLSDDVDQTLAWELFHEVMDEYHEICFERKLNC